ncbi:MerR family transcriptional regulator [Chloroflexota bacterium]
MTYTVKQLARFAGVSPRTLHYYDQIGLLPPSSYGDNGYRQYQEADMLRLQQILFYKELGLNLKNIQAILEQPDFEIMAALQNHKQALMEKQVRLQTLIQTVENTIDYLQGENTMSDNEIFKGFSEEQQKDYEEEVKQQFGEDNPQVKESIQKWGSYNQDQKQQILDEGGQIVQEMVPLMDGDPGAPEAQALAERYHRHINDSFYRCPYEIMRGLGEMYVQDSRFKASFDNIQAGLAQFLSDAVAIYTEGKNGYPD